MTRASNVVASTEAYIKTLLHSHKYPSQAVMGMLIGSYDDSASASSSSEGRVVVADVVPLFHTLPVCSPHPMLEVAFAHVQGLAKTQGQQVLGVYLANERRDDASISPLAKSVLEALLSRLKSSTGRSELTVWMVDNMRVQTPATEVAITSMTFTTAAEIATAASSAKPSSSSISFCAWCPTTDLSEGTMKAETAIHELNTALDAFGPCRLVDLEDHLENPRMDYLHQPVVALTRK